MRTLCAAILLSCFAGHSVAADKNEEAIGPSDIRARCENFSEMAGQIMGYRQDGGEMAEAMKIADGNGLIEQMVVQAFDIPRFSTERHQRRQVVEFKNKAYAKCFKMAPR